jgi:hypothetical protein
MYAELKRQALKYASEGFRPEILAAELLESFLASRRLEIPWPGDGIREV